MSIGSTTSSSASSFNFDGVVSGLSTANIISAMMKLEQGPLNQLQAQQTSVQARDTAYQALEGQVSALQASLHTLMLPSNVNAKTVASTTATVATATANSGATNASYALTVDHLATATTVSSSTTSGGTWVTAPIGAGLTSSNPLATAGFAIAPTAGTFTINGAQITIGDPTTQTLDSVVSAINASGASVQASLVRDANGNNNYIKLQNLGATPIQLGSGGDTSNFLTAAHLVSTGAAGDVASSVPLGTVNTSAVLSSVNFGTALTAQTGSFQVNGKQITWDASKDSVSSILNKINVSGAGVTAVYDPTQDAVTLTNIATGSQSIALSNDTGGVLAALHLGSAGGQQNLGKTAQFQINGGAWQYSNSNTITNSLPGVSVSLAGPGSTTLSVSQDTQSTIKNVQAFVTAFNTLVDAIDKDTAYDATNKQAAVLTGDSGITDFVNQLRGMLVNPVSGLAGQYTTLASVGISTGAFGSSVGSTNHLVLDEGKLTAALQADPNSVVSIIAGSATTTLNPGAGGSSGSGTWLAAISGTPLSSQHGQYRVTVDATGNVSAVFTPDGSSPLAATHGTISANGTNTSLIPGLTMTAGALPPSGSATDTIRFGQSGILGALNDFITRQLGTGGVFDTEHTAANEQLKSLSSQITTTNAQLAQRQQTLQQQFTAMETALAQLNAQSGSLMASLGSTSSTSSTGTLRTSG
jgi:flagellar hook-associated protein 2